MLCTKTEGDAIPKPLPFSKTENMLVVRNDKLCFSPKGRLQNPGLFLLLVREQVFERRRVGKGVKDGFENHRGVLAQFLAQDILIALAGKYAVKGVRQGLAFHSGLHVRATYS